MIILMSDHQQKRLCSVEGCESKHYGHGLCSKHYQRNWDHGDVHHERPRWHGGRRKGHSLYAKWGTFQRRAGGVDPAWSDFDRFIADVGEKREGCALIAPNPRAPIGPDNFAWRVVGKGHPKPNKRQVERCTRDECSRPARSIGLCALHYDRWIKRGRFDAPGVAVDPAKKAASVRRTRLRQYGLTPEQYDAMAEAQGGCCAICGGQNQNGRLLSIDHDHETGVVRALLCAPCNTGIGMFVESEDRLLKAIEYLRSHTVERAA